MAHPTPISAPNPDWRANITAVIFDCDGVLIDSEIISARMLRKEVAERGIDLSIDYIMQNYIGRSYPKVLEDIQKRFNVTLPPDFEAAYRNRLLAAFDAELRPMPDVHAVITGLGVPYALATSSTPVRLARSLEKTGLDGLFADNRFTASQVRNGKPAPDLFLLTAQKMGFDPATTLVIEDSVLGVKAGLAAGMKTARFIGGSHLSPDAETAGAELVFDKFANFFDLFADLKR